MPGCRKTNSDSKRLQQSVGVYFQGATQGHGRQASDPLQLGLWVRDVLKGQSGFGNQDIFGLQFSGQVVHGSGVCRLILPWRNSLSLCVNDDIYSKYFSTLRMLSTTAILVI